MSTKDTPWIKSTDSSQTGDCVSMRRLGDFIEVRDDKHPDGPIHKFTPSEWTAWLNGAKRGEFDHLA